jgi:DNA-binding FadR family transcriptional regulator
MADFEFHSAIVRASKSETLISMYKAMQPLFIRLHKERREVIDVDPTLKAQIIEDHRKIFRALAEKDEQGADEQMRLHFQIGDERRYKATFKTALI